MWATLITLACAADLTPLWSHAAPPPATPQGYGVAWWGPDDLLVGGARYVDRWRLTGRAWTVAYDGPFVRAVAPAASAPWAVVGADDGSVRLRARDDGRVWMTLRPARLPKDVADPSEWVLAVAVSPDDRLVAAGTLGGGLQVWRTADGAPLPLRAPARAHGAAPPRIESLAFDPTGRSLYVAGDFGPGTPLVVVDAVNGGSARWRTTLPDTTRHGYAVAVSPTGRLIALGGFGGSLEVRRPDGTVVWSQVRSKSWVGPVAFTPDGAHLVAAAPEGLAVLDPHTGAVRAQLEVFVTGIAVHPSGLQLATVHHTEARVRRFRLPDLAPLDQPRGPFATADQLSISPDGATLAVASTGGPGLRLFDLQTGAINATEPDVSCVGWGGVKWSPAGTLLAIHDCDYDRGVRVVHADTLTSASPTTYPTNGEAWFTADGRHLVVMDAFAYDRPRVYEIATGRPEDRSVVRPSDHPFATSLRPVDPVDSSFEPPSDVVRALWGSRSVLRNHWLHLYVSGALRPAPGDRHAGFSQDLRTTAGVRGDVVTVYRDGEAWGQLTLNVAAVAVSPDGRTLAVGHADGSVAAYTTPQVPPPARPR